MAILGWGKSLTGLNGPAHLGPFSIWLMTSQSGLTRLTVLFKNYNLLKFYDTFLKYNTKMLWFFFIIFVIVLISKLLYKTPSLGFKSQTPYFTNHRLPPLNHFLFLLCMINRKFLFIYYILCDFKIYQFWIYFWYQLILTKM